MVFKKTNTEKYFIFTSNIKKDIYVLTSLVQKLITLIYEFTHPYLYFYVFILMITFSCFVFIKKVYCSYRLQSCFNVDLIIMKYMIHKAKSTLRHSKQLLHSLLFIETCKLEKK